MERHAHLSPTLKQHESLPLDTSQHTLTSFAENDGIIRSTRILQDSDSKTNEKYFELYGGVGGRAGLENGNAGNSRRQWLGL